MPLNTYGDSLGPAAGVYTKTYTSSPPSLTRGPHLSSSSSSPHLSLLMGASKGCGREPPLAVCSTGGVEGWGRLEEEAAARPRGLGGCCVRGHGGPELLRLEPLRGHGGRSCCAAMVGGACAQLWWAEALAPRALLAPPGMAKQQ